MALNRNFYEIAKQWPEYRLNHRIDSGNSTHKLVTEAVPNELKGILSGQHELKPEGSCGRGNVSSAPWITVLTLTHLPI